nr:cryptochrome/photolyase family protein [Rubrivivax sp.]
MAAEVRQLVLVLGDQLDRASSAFDGFDPARDAVWMAEVDAESTHGPSSKAGTAMFLSALRHFADGLRAEGFVRQILGWREYVRGIYWTRMPGYLDLDALDAHEALPAFYWRGDMPLACLAD